MPTLPIGGIKVQYNSYDELGEAVKKKIHETESRLKQLDAERNTLQRQRRALKGFFGGKATPKREHPPKVLAAAV